MTQEEGISKVKDIIILHTFLWREEKSPPTTIIYISKLTDSSNLGSWQWYSILSGFCKSSCVDGIHTTQAAILIMHLDCSYYKESFVLHRAPCQPVYDLYLPSCVAIISWLGYKDLFLWALLIWSWMTRMMKRCLNSRPVIKVNWRWPAWRPQKD